MFVKWKPLSMHCACSQLTAATVAIIEENFGDNNIALNDIISTKHLI